MTRYPDNKKVVPIAALRGMADGLRAIAAEYDRVVAALDSEKADSIEALGLITGMEGLGKVCKFFGNISEGYCNRIAAQSVGEIAGATAELNRKIFRIKDSAASSQKDDELPPGTDQGETVVRKRKRAKK